MRQINEIDPQLRQSYRLKGMGTLRINWVTANMVELGRWNPKRQCWETFRKMRISTFRKLVEQ